MSVKDPTKNSGNKRIIYIIVGLALLFLTIKSVPLTYQLNGESDITIEVHSEYVDEGAVGRFDGKQLQAIGEVDTDTVGDYVISYPALFQTGHRKVHVVDTTAPVINVDKDIILVRGVDELPVFEVSDNYDGDLSDQLVIDGDVDSDTAGKYSLELSVSDSSGNQTQKSVTVFVRDDDLDYLDSFYNETRVPEEALGVIRELLNRFYYSFKYLRYVELGDLFSEKSQDLAYLYEKALEATADYRDLSSNDLRMDDCSYSVNILSFRNEGRRLRITFTEDSRLRFRFLNGLESNQGKIYHELVLVKEDDVYKINDFTREEGVFLSFLNSYEGGGNEAIDAIKDDYLKVMADASVVYANDEEGESAETETPEVTHPYDRAAARAYAVLYGNKRNEHYGSYESNCVNFVSQCMFAGGIEMDDEGMYQWKWFSEEYNEDDKGKGYTYAWTYIPSFAEYLENGDIVNEIDVPLYLAEAGDVIYVDNGDDALEDSPHVILVSDRVYDEDGELIDLLICGNTNDQANYPVGALTYPYKKLIKIYGYN